MDHKVSKDMISSGMIPSGEKTQADLSRTQYGSAPSPNKLMDAYHSMYQNQKEETLDEKMGDAADFASRNIKGAKGASKPPTPEKTGRSQEEIKKSVDQSIQKGRERAEKRERLQGIMNKYGESVDLLAAYRAVYEHHKKDEDGNTIPHEDDVKEGKIPAGLQAYLDKKKGKKENKKEDKKDMKEEVDKFDVVFNHFISEGYSEKEAYAKMANLTEEQLDEMLGAITRATKSLATRAAQYGANLGKPASQKINVVNPPRKPFDAKRKPFDAKKPEPKPGDSGFKANTASDVVTAAAATRRKRMEKEMEPRKGEVMADEYQYVNEIAQFIPMIMKGAATVGKALKPVADAAKKVVKSDTVKNLATQTAVSSVVGGMGGGGQKQRTGTVSNTQYASADLFDIVKGQLLDEGLSEEEIKDIMLTLTPDEILKEIEESSMSAGSSDGHYHDGGDGVFRSKQQIGNMFNKNIPTKKQTGGKVDKMTRKSINTSARELGIQGPTTLKQSVEPKGETI